MPQEPAHISRVRRSWNVEAVGYYHAIQYSVWELLEPHFLVTVHDNAFKVRLRFDCPV